MAQASLIRLLEISASLPSATLRSEQRELVQSLARELNVSLPDGAPEETRPVKEEKKSGSSSVSAARAKFQNGGGDHHQSNGNGHHAVKKEARKSTVRHSTVASGPAGNADCDISSPQIKNAYVVFNY